MHENTRGRMREEECMRENAQQGEGLKKSGGKQVCGERGGDKTTLMQRVEPLLVQSSTSQLN